MQHIDERDLSFWHRDTYRIYHKDVDYASSLRLSSLLTMLQESAWNHAQVLGIDYSNEGFRDKHWVMSRLKVRMTSAAPLWMEDAHVATYPSGVDRLFANRDFILHKQDGGVFALASSSWLIINAATRQLCRPEPLLDGFKLHPMETVLPEGTRKLKDFQDGRLLGQVQAAYHEVDAHQHVNNVVYAQWCLSFLDREFFATHRLKSFEVNFLSEAIWGDQIQVLMKEEGGVQDYTLRKADGSPAATLSFAWEMPEENLLA